MNTELFEKIAQEANDKFHEYYQLNLHANFIPPIVRKEDFASYWIAVVAFQEGYQTGLGNKE